MKALIEVVRLNVADIVTASGGSTPCGSEYTPIISACTDPEWD